MKKLTYLIAAFLVFNMSFAQDSASEEIQMVQELFGQEKRMIIEDNVDLTGVDGVAFWKLYDEYEAQRQDLGKAKLELLQKYTTKQGDLTNAQAKDLLMEAVPLRTSEDKLILNYTKRIEKATSALVSVQFYQIEHYISDGIRFAILNNIDFIQDKK
ncbi:hypothetical protein LCM02_05635 [Lutimonas saemankumensis]|uniref:hypothetical protein n=1 Tax=Lutimonas saemankumensis TaxID=483016 RepID=UPI001CD22743|nr:hypothetical protein [Lutimonas saemankumensis]MCA0931924.1 hypothetical protein [Lutimonas saemankumensis]